MVVRVATAGPYCRIGHLVIEVPYRVIVASKDVGDREHEEIAAVLLLSQQREPEDSDRQRQMSVIQPQCSIYSM